MMSVRKNNQLSEDLGNYQIRPNLNDSFKVAAVKEIINQVMHETLEGNNIVLV